MDFLSQYTSLSKNEEALELDQLKKQHSNPLNITQGQARKVKRLLSARLTNSNLTFMQSFENPQKQFDEAQEQKQTKWYQSLKKIEIQNYLTFSLITKSNIADYEILINFSINLKKATLSFESKILKNYRFMKIESKMLVRFMAKYFLSYNGKLKQGSFFVNPTTAQISFFIHNILTLDSINSLVRNPQKFLVIVMFYIDQITKKWNQCIDSILYLVNKKKYDQIRPSKKFQYVKSKLARLSQMIIHSHIDASFFIENKGISRFKKIGEQDRKNKITQLRNQYSFMEKRNKHLDAIYPLIKKYIGNKKIQQTQFKFPQWQMTQIKQMSENLCCHDYSGRSNIYSQIEIFNVNQQMCIFQSGFSKIFQIQAQIKRQEEPIPTRAFLIKKKTQQKRHKNQVLILKLIQKQKFLFLPRYYFCQQQEHKQSIFIEFIPQSSLDRYLMTKSMFIGNQTKLFFLFMVIIALRFLRDNSIVHIDLKPQNVLIKIVGDARQNVHYLVKLIDFGQSFSPKIDSPFSGKESSGRGFTIPYAPPQLLSKGKTFTEKTDVYSFGIIMYKVMFNHFPLQIMKMGKTQFIEEQYLRFYSIPYQKLQNFGTMDFTSLLYFLCLKCLQPNPNDRPSLDWLCLILKDIILTYDELTK